MQNNWGGPDSSDKRDWFAGAVVDLFPPIRIVPAAATAAARQQAQQEEPELEDVEAVLLQVMIDEFEVNVDDDSALGVAEDIVRMRGQCVQGVFTDVDSLRERWQTRTGKGGGSVEGLFKKGEDADQDTDWESDDSDGGDDADVDMGDAPALVEKKEKPLPEIDQDGFTKVTNKKR